MLAGWCQQLGRSIAPIIIITHAPGCTSCHLYLCNDYLCLWHSRRLVFCVSLGSALISGCLLPLPADCRLFVTSFKCPAFASNEVNPPEQSLHCTTTLCYSARHFSFGPRSCPLARSAANEVRRSHELHTKAEVQRRAFGWLWNVFRYLHVSIACRVSVSFVAPSTCVASNIV